MKSMYKIFSALFSINILVRLVDVVKNLIVSARLGVSNFADIFLAVSVIPDSLLILLGIDSIKGVLNSEYSSLAVKHENIELLNRSLSNLIKLFLFLSVFITIIITVFNELILQAFLPGFNSSDFQNSLLISYFIFPTILFKILITLLTPFYNSIKKYYLPVFSQLSVSVCIIVALFLPYYGSEIIYNIAIGFLIGHLIYCLILLLPIIIRLKGFFNWKLKLDPISIKIIKNCLTLFLVTFVNQLYLSSRNFFVSYFGEGSISSLSYASAIPIFISSFTFNIVFSILLHKLSSSFELDIKIKSKKLFIESLKILFLIIVPIVIMLISFPIDILSLIYLRGNFDISGIYQTLKPFIWESLSLLNFIFYIIPVALFLSKKRYLTLTKIGIVIYSLGIILNYIFVSIYGFYGVSIANFVVTFLYSILLILNSRKFLGRYNSSYLYFVKLFICGIIVFALTLALKTYLHIYPYTLGDIIGSLLNLTLIFIAIASLFLLLLLLFKINIFRYLLTTYKNEN